MEEIKITWRSNHPELNGKEEEIVRLHFEELLSVVKIADRLGSSRKLVKKVLVKNGYQNRPTSSPLIAGREDEILRMYNEEMLTVQTIRKKIGCDYNAIKNFLKRNNVKLRTADESRMTEDGKVRRMAQKLLNPKDLEDAIEMYKNGEVFEKIGAIYNISPAGLRAKFKKMGVKLRTLTESANLPTTYARKKETYLKNYGVENPMQCPEITEKSRTTCMELYGKGVEGEVFNKMTRNAFRYKSHMVNGKTFHGLQGYEPQAINYLVFERGYSVDDISSGKTIPKIKFIFNGRRTIYFPDLYIEKENMLIEVKCDYTYENHLEKNIAKRKAAIDSGYLHITIMFDRKGKRVVEVF